MTINSLELTRALMRMDSINPPGNETHCTKLVGGLLEDHGFEARYYEFAPGRATLVARIGGAYDTKPLCLTGHVDTVPLGIASWQRDPLAAEIDGDLVYGRGASDMKSGVAAMVACACELAPYLHKSPGMMLVLTAGEETGCEGAFHLVQSTDFEAQAGALVVGEPTANYPMVGHKGALWLRAITTGVTAHGSMPEQGTNAIYPLAKAISRLEGFELPGSHHAVLGMATLNVGVVRGGLNINSVPDAASVDIDIRSNGSTPHAELLASLCAHLGDALRVETLLDVGAVYTEPSHPWIEQVFDFVGTVTGDKPTARAVTYFSDASALGPALGWPPTIILGPGEPMLAHKTDEYCRITRLQQSVAIYSQIVRDWCRV